MGSLRSLLLNVQALCMALTVKRVLNVLKKILCYGISWASQQPRVVGLPISISIEPTSICQLRCPECPTGMGVLKRSRGSIELQHFKKVVDELSPYLIYLNLYVQGEPFMHPQFDVLVRYARSKSIYTSTSTNGHFINAVMAHKIVEAGLTRLIFSLDGITQQSYTKYRRGGDVEVVKQAIRDVVAAKKHHRKRFPLVIIQFLVFKHNEHEMDDLVLLANNLGVDKVEFKSAQFNDFGFGEVEEPENATYARYSNRMLKHPMRNRCWRMWQAPVVTWDGAVCPCCYDKDAEWSFGNAFQIPIAKLLHSPSYKEFASKVFVDKQQLNMCHNCPEGRGWF